jgi:uncharacterized membrane protein YcjF (UPF0283 family)
MQMNSTIQNDFATELGKLRASNNSGPTDRRIGWVGVLLAIAGLVVILVSFQQARGYADIRDQMDSLILSLFGVGLIILGAALYLRSVITRFLRYWLLRMVYEQRDLARSVSPTDSTPGRS